MPQEQVKSVTVPDDLEAKIIKPKIEETTKLKLTQIQTASIEIVQVQTKSPLKLETALDSPNKKFKDRYGQPLTTQSRQSSVERGVADLVILPAKIQALEI